MCCFFGEIAAFITIKHQVIALNITFVAIKADFTFFIEH